MAMTLTERRIGDVTVLALKGRLVLDDGEVVLRTRMNALVAEGRTKVVVDLRGVTYVDSCGVGVLAEKYLSVRRKGGELKLLHLSPRSHHLLAISGLMTIFEAFDSETEAVSSFSA